MPRKVVAYAKVKIVISVDDDADVHEVLSELEYEFSDTTTQATINDTEILDWTIEDSR